MAKAAREHVRVPELRRSVAPRWTGKCAACGEWNTIVEEAQAAAAGHGLGQSSKGRAAELRLLADTDARQDAPRMPTGTCRARSRDGRRHRAGLRAADRRRAGHRQIDAAAAGGRGVCGRRAAGRLLLRRGSDRPGALARRAAGPGQMRPWRSPAKRACPTCWRRWPRASPPDLVVDRFDPDAVGRWARGRAGNREPGARRDPGAGAVRQDARARRCCSSGTSPRTARSPAPRSSSTWSIRCFISRATAGTPSASCGPPRTASAPPTRSACSRWRPKACARSPTRPSCFSAIGWHRARARPCSRASKARGPSSSRYRRWSCLPASARRDARWSGGIQPPLHAARRARCAVRHQLRPA